MDEKRKAISADDRLRAIGLFTVAKEHATKAREFEDALCRLLDIEQGGLLGDLIWDSTAKASIAVFDDALAGEGIVAASK